jgi:hypothetical protein
MKVPAYWTLHWNKTGLPTGSWWAAKDAPKITDFPEGFFGVFHPEQEIQETLMPCITERRGGFINKIKEIDITKFLELGSRLTLKQRLKGVA